MKILFIIFGLVFTLTACNSKEETRELDGEQVDSHLYDLVQRVARNGDISAFMEIKQKYPKYWEKMQKKVSDSAEAEDKKIAEDTEKAKLVTTLMGFDLSLDYEKFKEQYADSVIECGDRDRIGSEKSFIYYVCHMKGGFQFTFAGLGDQPKLLRSMSKDYSESDNVLTSVFNKKLSEKTGIDTGSSYSDEVNIPYYQGKLYTQTGSKTVDGQRISYLTYLKYSHNETLGTLLKQWQKEGGTGALEEMKKKAEAIEL